MCVLILANILHDFTIILSNISFCHKGREETQRLEGATVPEHEVIEMREKKNMKSEKRGKNETKTSIKTVHVHHIITNIQHEI